MQVYFIGPWCSSWKRSENWLNSSLKRILREADWCILSPTVVALIPLKKYNAPFIKVNASNVMKRIKLLYVIKQFVTFPSYLIHKLCAIFFRMDTALGFSCLCTLGWIIWNKGKSTCWTRTTRNTPCMYLVRIMSLFVAT